MFVKLRSFKGKKDLYFCLQESYRSEDGKPKTRHVAYLGKKPVEKLEKLIALGKLTVEQVADITFTNDYSRIGYDLLYFLQDLRGQKSPKECDIEKVAKISMWLRVENNNKYIRGKKKVRDRIEQYLKYYYKLEHPEPKSWEYIFHVKYTTTEGLVNEVYDILREMDFEADLRNCFIEADVNCEELGLSW